MAPTVDVLRETLASLSLDTRGHKDVLSRRLARHQRAQRTPSPPAPRTSSPPANRPRGQPYDAFLCFDVEATCEHFQGQVGRQAFSWPNEIIEFPVVLLKWCETSLPRQARPLLPSEPPEDEQEQSSDRNESKPASGDESDDGSDDPTARAETSRWELNVVDEFHSYVRPKHRTKLSKFCRDLTEITQAQVDSAPYYPAVLKRFEKEFIAKHDLFTKEVKTVWVTDGPWDLRDFVAKQVFLSHIPRPPWLGGNVIDLRKLVTSYFASPPPDPASSPTPLRVCDPPPSVPLAATESLSIPSVLSALSLPPFIGHLHSGLDDARNASRILVELYRRNVVLDANLVVPRTVGREKRWEWMGKDGNVLWDKVLGLPEARREG